jgi:type I restriction enzyme R subunit
VSLVRFAIEDEQELVPWSDTIDERFNDWLDAQGAQGVEFSEAQLQWLGMIKDQVAGGLRASFDDLMDAPFSQHGGLAKAREIFGNQLGELLAELTAVLAA